ncbi:MAG: large conductance mechanosensitive channel protein MscL, partial [Bacteroidales bacterium]|nr:large conductance mechanosensitive channel protein MscL [Bacteroidales bacterium]
IGMLLGGVDFSEIFITLKQAEGDVAAVTMNIGVFINTVIEFIIVAFSIFMVVKGMNSMKKKEEAKPAEPPKPSEEVLLLKEIRDSLKK